MVSWMENAAMGKTAAVTAALPSLVPNQMRLDLSIDTLTLCPRD